MSSLSSLRLSSVLACAALALVAGSGCLSSTYEVAPAELARLVELPPEERGERVRATQQTSFSNDVSDEELDGLSRASEPAIWLSLESHAHVDASSASGDDASPAEEALAALVVAGVVATTAAVTVGVTEGARYDGWIAAPADQPVLLVERSGARRWTELAALEAADVAGVERAVIPELGADIERLARAPLDRAGFTYRLELGAASVPTASGDTELGTSGRVELGYLPAQRYGVSFGAAFDVARSSATAPWADALDVDYRMFSKFELWPLHAGRLHAGAFAELGPAWVLRDTALDDRRSSGLATAAGLVLELEASTRLALSLRLTAAWLPALQGDVGRFAPAGYRFEPAVTFGVSVY